MKLIQTLWRDEQGNSAVMSTILLATIVAIGSIVGLTTLRDQIVQEFGDFAAALENIDQSFTAGPCGSFTDPTDPAADSLDPDGAAPFGLDLSEDASKED